MSEKNIAIAVAYYQAMNKKDLSAMEKYLHPEVRLIGPLADITGKDAVLDSVKHLIAFFNKLTIRAQFGAEDRVMLAYDINFPAPIGISRAAVLLTFQDDLIIRYELFFDARPFEKR
jgi:ketosteroid isomerase-like protein